MASVLLCSGFIECLGEGLRDGYVELGSRVFSMPCSMPLSSAMVEVAEEPMFETIVSELFI